MISNKLEQEKEAHTNELLDKITNNIENNLEKQEIKPIKRKREKKQPKNPIKFIPVKKELNKYTVSGNVNSKGIKYKVVEIIDAQDEKLANSIFRERAKKNLAGVRNVTKVNVELYKEGDEPSKEEIVENLPKSEPIVKPITKKKAIDIVTDLLNKRETILRKVLEKLIHHRDIALFKISLRDKSNNKSLLTAYKILYMPKVNNMVRDVNGASSFFELEKSEQNKALSAIIKADMPYLANMYDRTKHEITMYELDWNNDSFSNKEISTILNTLEGESPVILELVNDLTKEVVNELGYDIENISFINLT